MSWWLHPSQSHWWAVGAGLTAPWSPGHECQGAVGLWGGCGHSEGFWRAHLQAWGNEEVPGAPHACQIQAGLVDLVWPKSLALSPPSSKHPGGSDKEFLKNE